MYVKIKFFGCLNDFLPSKKRRKSFDIPVTTRQSVKDIIESAGIPHTEIDLIVVNNRSVKFSDKIKDNDDIKVYPPGYFPRGVYHYHLQKKDLKYPRFMLDVHLGRLARLLRMCGIDTGLFKGDSDKDLVDSAIREKRIVLTRDINLLKRSILKRGYWIRNDNPEKQLSEILRRFELIPHFKQFHRCMCCNGLIKSTGKKTVLDRIPPRTGKWLNEFFKCTSCGKIYWNGSHYLRMAVEIERLTHFKL